MTHKPNVVGDAVLNTTLALEDTQYNTIATCVKQNGDSRLDFIALKDGDYYLDASGGLPSNSVDPKTTSIDAVCSRSTPTLTAIEGKYAISAVEIPHNAYTIGSTVNDNFDGTTNHVGYKVTLNAGDYVSFNFTADGSPNVLITDAQGVKVDAFTQSGTKQNNQYFMAQKLGTTILMLRLTTSLSIKRCPSKSLAR